MECHAFLISQSQYLSYSVSFSSLIGINLFLYTLIFSIFLRREHFTCDHSIVMALLGVMGPLMAVGTT